MTDDAAKKEHLALRLRRRLERSWHSLSGLAEDHPMVTELGSELMRGSPQAREMLRQLGQIISVAHLRQMSGLLQLEPCSVAVAGPVNAGKSTLLNALAGRTVAEVAATPGTTSAPESYRALGFRLIDTPGADEVAGEERRAAALSSAEEASVTILVFDASRGITSSDRQVFDQVVAAIVERETKARTASDPAAELTPSVLADRRRLVVALNKSDMVPRSERDEVRDRAARDLGLPSAGVLMISALRRRGLDRLIKRMVDGAPGMVEALVEVMPEYVEVLAGQLIHRYAVAAATLAMNPFPVSDVLPLTALQLALVIRLSRVYGHRMSWRRSREVLPTVAAGLGWRELFRQVAKLVPVGGWALSSTIAYAGTYVVGRSAQYLLRTGERPTDEQLASWRREAGKQSKRRSSL